ncbi:hypothetical protein PAECIP111893_04864 [Paenibacillus plantiphilus]|uniref:Uncharacterized protein n=1 Tax=Paenibacillus plantiphilus TaxID=2905650 RepID=A0ABN8GZD8_9BACL|nr:hypothetical protein [Paenibacillus plantiphilus]CAH1222565.1 hypothetical protein PAECIP111893_04864 [Paenibacillus plantiphilus]
MKRMALTVIAAAIMFTAFSGAVAGAEKVLKSRHETAKNSIGNIR